MARNASLKLELQQQGDRRWACAKAAAGFDGVRSSKVEIHFSRRRTSPANLLKEARIMSPEERGLCAQTHKDNQR